MDKKEFLEKLTLALAGQVPRQAIEENIRYYDNYITEELKNGKDLGRILEELGDPRLIAKSIIDANGGGDEMAGVYQDSDGEGREYGSSSAEGRFSGGTVKNFQFNGIWLILLFLVAGCSLITIIGTVIGGIFMLLRPVLVPLLVVFLIYSVWKGPKR